MRFLCVLCDNECVKCQNEEEVKHVIKDWLDDGHAKEDIEVFRWGPSYPFKVKTTHTVTFTEEL